MGAAGRIEQPESWDSSAQQENGGTGASELDPVLVGPNPVARTAPRRLRPSTTIRLSAGRQPTPHSRANGNPMSGPRPSADACDLPSPLRGNHRSIVPPARMTPESPIRDTREPEATIALDEDGVVVAIDDAAEALLRGRTALGEPMTDLAVE